MMEEFLVDLNNEISIQSSVNGETNQDSFFEIISDLLIENGDCKEAQIVNDWNNEKSGIQINGYGGAPLNDENILSILIDVTDDAGPVPLAIFTQAPPSPYSNPFADELTFNVFPAAPIDVNPVPPLVVGKVPEEILPAFKEVKFAPLPTYDVEVVTPVTTKPLGAVGAPVEALFTI